MNVFTLMNGQVSEASELPEVLPPSGFVWVSVTRREFEVMQPTLAAALHSLCGCSLVDLHVSDLLNNQLPSHHDDTSSYDVLVFRRLAPGHSEADLSHPGEPLHQAAPADVPKALNRINTHPVGFAVFDRLLLSVHPAECSVRDAYEDRLRQPNPRGPQGRLPTDPGDLMLRIINQMVDGYLDLRRELTRDMDRWHEGLLSQNGHFNQWRSLLHTRLSLHQLDEICEDQRAAIQDWIEAIKTWAAPTDATQRRERELLLVRSRDVLEHIERVIHHVDRLERSAETAVQMHLSLQGNRTNDTMKTLTALTAVFLPLNLITGFFGMNFEFLPLIHNTNGLWWAVTAMVLIGLALVLYFWRKRLLLTRSDHA